MFLLDTVVLSELRKRDRHPNVLRWLSATPASAMFLSSITIGEIERGIALQRTRNPVFAGILEKWLEETISHHVDRIIPVSIGIARRWGELSAIAGHDGADLLIAATALESGLAVVTRNVRHFRETGVSVFNPWEG